ncbi:MAG: hypothetical protein FWG31_06815 [Oscillospiraceae bacterium]|nr:hypothetical protein [Oscillospiraceae bacterium]
MLAGMARYLKNLLPSEIPAGYSVNPMFTKIESEETIRNGVFAFRGFIDQLYDLLIADGEQYEKPNAKNLQRPPSLAVDTPFIYHVRSVLLNLGYHSRVSGDSLTFCGLKTLTPIICCEGMEATSKISAPRLMECLRFLSGCGIYFEGIDLDAAKPVITHDEWIEATYPDNPALLTGLKIMAVAQRDLRWKTNDEIFLRCDYRALSNDKTNAADALKDFISPFSSEIQEFILYLHQKSILAGLKCTVKIGLKNSFHYAHKKNAVWELSSSFADGYRLSVKDAKGSGVSLDDSFLDNSREFEGWIDMALFKRMEREGK